MPCISSKYRRVEIFTDIVEFVNEKIRTYPLIDKLYRNYQIYRNSFGAKKAAVIKVFTPG